MTFKLVKRYRCDFCTKRTLSAPSMHKHETRCTKNPNRHCSMCVMIGDVQKPIAELKAVVPQHPESFWSQTYENDTGYDPSSELTIEANQAVISLRKLTKCPACILAALRQSGVPVWCATDFDFKKEMTSAMDAVNDAATNYY